MLTAIGLMSGTSMDGIDVALLRTDGGDRIERGPFRSYPYSPATRRRIEAGLRDAQGIERRTDRPGLLAELEDEITERHAAAVEAFFAETGTRTSEVDLVGFHGQTVLHRPERGLTVQLGKGGVLARALGLRVVHDMRQLDIEAGGQGAPLVPVYHRALASTLEEKSAIAFLNIGGIANVTIVGDELLAFDCGPGNAMIDDWMVRKAGLPYDDGGRIASEGAIDQAFVARMLAAPFFMKSGPKSLDRNDFTVPNDWNAELSDGARTLARLTAEAVAAHVPLLPDKPAAWIVSGGGARNATIMTDLQELLAPATVRKAEEASLSSDAMEAEAWAYLAVRVAKGRPISEPGTTGRRALSENRAKFGEWL